MGRDARVAVFMDNHPEFVVAMFGTWRCGAALVPCNARLTPEELSFLVSDSGAAVVITDEARATTARAAAGDAIVCVAGPELGAILESESVPAASRAGRRAIRGPGLAVLHLGYDRTTQGGHAVPRHAHVRHGVVAGPASPRSTRTMSRCMPLRSSHGAGFHALAATARAAHQLIPDTPSFDPLRTLDLVRAYGVTNTWMVPTQIVMLTEAAPPEPDLPSLGVHRLRRRTDHGCRHRSSALTQVWPDLRAAVRPGRDADDGDGSAAGGPSARALRIGRTCPAWGGGGGPRCRREAPLVAR